LLCEATFLILAGKVALLMLAFILLLVAAHGGQFGSTLFHAGGNFSLWFSLPIQ
jgi:hypothetical protein